MLYEYNTFKNKICKNIKVIAQVVLEQWLSTAAVCVLHIKSTE